jgi:hypothetical protein
MLVARGRGAARGWVRRLLPVVAALASLAVLLTGVAEALARHDHGEQVRDHQCIACRTADAPAEAPHVATAEPAAGDAPAPVHDRATCDPPRPFVLGSRSLRGPPLA